MPLDVSRMVFRGALLHDDVKQYADLLTGTMTDQPVTLNNQLTVGSNLRVGTSPVADPANSTIVAHNPRYVQSPTDWSRVALTWPTNGAAMLLAQSNSSTYGPLGLTIGTDGSAGLSFRTSGSARWEIHSGGDIRPLTHNWYDIGTVSMRPRALYIAGGGITTNGNLTLEGTGRRITGDMSDATPANRLMFQTSVANGATTLGVLPLGTGTAGALIAYDKSDSGNAVFGQLAASAGGVLLSAGRSGTAAFPAITFHTSGAERMRIGVDGVTDIVAPRATGNLTPSSGVGIELVYIEPNAYVQSLARNPVAWKDLNISGRNINFYLNGGMVTLAGSLEMQANKIRFTDVAYAIFQSGSYMYHDSWSGFNWRNSQAGFRQDMGLDVNGSLWVRGDVSGATITNRSQSTFKSVLGTLDPAHSLQSVLGVKPVRYTWHDNMTKPHQGFIAEDVAANAPQLAVLKDGVPEGVDVTGLVATLWSAVQHLNARVAALEAA